MAKRAVGERLTTGEVLTRKGGAAAAERGLGEMPLTLWVIVAAVVLYLYVRRSKLGIDRHPGEGARVAIPTKQTPMIRIPGQQPFPVLPGVDVLPPGFKPVYGG